MKELSAHDDLYAQKRVNAEGFVFDEKVANVFEDMIHRSVPGYRAIISMIGCLAEQYVQTKSVCYDLGCSLGAATLSMARSVESTDCRIVAVDNSSAMIEKCQKNILKAQCLTPIDFVCEDIQDILIQNASVVVLNFTLQFVEPKMREGFLKKVFDGLLPGGILIISEKIAFEDEDEQKLQTELHHTFKKLNGYSDLEIAQKRTALEDVLIPDTLPEHQERLKRIGFNNSNVWFQCFNFISMVAFKL